MSTLSDDFGGLLEVGEVAFLLRGEKPKPLKERDHVLDDGHEVVDLVIPDPIVSLPHRPATEVTLEQRQDHLIALRDVEAERDLPRSLVVVPRTERHVEAPFTVGKTSEVITDVRWDLAYVEHQVQAFPADYPHLTDC